MQMQRQHANVLTTLLAAVHQDTFNILADYWILQELIRRKFISGLRKRNNLIVIPFIPVFDFHFACDQYICRLN
jgi:hypothetical protein